MQPDKCELYKHTQPSLIIEKHHIIPESWFHVAGVMVDTPFAHLCPTCHMNTHWWIDQLVSGRVPLPRLAPFRAYQLALKGYTLGKAAGLTPRRTL